SHFRSTEIWQTASDSETFEKYGWIGRYFDNACSGCDPTVGVNIGRQMPQAFAAAHPKGVSVDNPQNYRFINSENGQDGQMMEQSYKELNQADDNSGGSIASITGPAQLPNAHRGSVMDFLERTALDAQVSSDEIRAISARVDNKATYP